MQLTDSHLTNDVCSCTSCYYESQSCDPKVQRVLRDGSRIDRLFLGKYIPLRERKLLKRLARTRAVYDDITCQVVDKSSTCIDKKYYTPRQPPLSCGECDDSEWSCVTGDFGNPVHQNRHVGGSCSCCSYDTIDSHLINQRQYRQNHGYTQGRYPRCSSASIRGARNVRFKSIKSEPCTCSHKISGSIRQRSKNIVKKLRRRPQLESSTDYSLGQYRKRRRHKTAISQFGESKSQFTQDEIKWKTEKTTEAIKIHKKHKSTKPDTGTKRSLEKLTKQITEQPFDSEESSFSIRKDSVAKFKDDLERRRRNYISKIISKYKPCKSVTPGCCLTEECDPRECYKILEKRRKRRARKENRIWHNGTSAIEAQRYKPTKTLKAFQKTSVKEIRSDISSAPTRGSIVEKKSLSTDEISKYQKGHGKMKKNIAVRLRENLNDKSETKNKYHKVGKAIPIREEIIDKSDIMKNENPKTVIKKGKNNTILLIRGKRPVNNTSRLQEEAISVSSSGNIQKEKGNRHRKSQTKLVNLVRYQKDDTYTNATPVTQSKKKKKIDIKFGSMAKSSTGKPAKSKITVDKETKNFKNRISQTNISTEIPSKKALKHKQRKCFCKMKLSSLIARGIVPELDEEGFVAHVCDEEVCTPKKCTELGSIQEQRSGHLIKRSSTDFNKSESTLPSAINKPDKKLDNVKIGAYKERKNVKDRRSQTSISSGKSSKKVTKYKQRKCFCTIKLPSCIARRGVPKSSKGSVAHLCDKEVCDPNECKKLEKEQEIKEKHSQTSISSEKSIHKVAKHILRKCFCKTKLSSLIARGIVPELDKKGFVAHVCDEEVCAPKKCTELESIHEQRSGRLIKRSSTDFNKSKSISSVVKKPDKTSNKIKVKANKETKHVKNRRSQTSISSGKSSKNYKQRKCFCHNKGFVAYCDPNECMKVGNNQEMQDRHKGRYIKRSSTDFNKTRSISSVELKPDKTKVKAEKEMKHVKDRRSQTSISSGISSKKVTKYKQKKCFCHNKGFVAHCDPNECMKLEKNQKVDRHKGRFIKRFSTDFNKAKSVSSVVIKTDKTPDKAKVKADKETKHVKDRLSQTSISSEKSIQKVTKHKRRKCFCKMKLSSLIARGIVPELDEEGFVAHVCDKEICDPNECAKLESIHEQNSGRLIKRSNLDFSRNKSISVITKFKEQPDKMKMEIDRETKQNEDKHSQTSISSRKSSKKLAKHRQRKCFCKVKLSSLIARGIVPELDEEGFVAHVCDKEICDPNKCTKLESIHEQNSGRFIKRSNLDFNRNKSISRVLTKSKEQPDKMKMEIDQETKQNEDKHSQTSISSRKSSKKLAKHRQRKCFCKVKLSSLIARGIVPELDKGFIAHVCDKEVCHPKKCIELESVHQRHSDRYNKRLSTDTAKSRSTLLNKHREKPDKMKKEQKHFKDRHSHTSTSSGKSGKNLTKHRLRKCFCRMKLPSLSNSFTVGTEMDDIKHRKKNKQHTRQTVTNRTKLRSASSITNVSQIKMTNKQMLTKIKPHTNELRKKRKSKKVLSPVVDLQIPRQTVHYGSNITFSIEFRKYTTKPKVYTVSKLSRNQCEWPNELNNIFRESVASRRRHMKSLCGESIFNLESLCKKSHFHREICTMNCQKLEREINLKYMPISLNCNSNICLTEGHDSNEFEKLSSKKVSGSSITEGWSMINIRKSYSDKLNKEMPTLNRRQKAFTSIGSKVNICLERSKQKMKKITVLNDDSTPSIKIASLDPKISYTRNKKLNPRYSHHNQTPKYNYQTELKMPMIEIITEKFHSPKKNRSKPQKGTLQLTRRHLEGNIDTYPGIIKDKNQGKHYNDNQLQFKKSSMKNKNIKVSAEAQKNSSRQRDIINYYVPPEMTNQKAQEYLEKRKVIRYKPITSSVIVKRCFNTANIRENKVHTNTENVKDIQQKSFLKKCICLLKVKGTGNEHFKVVKMSPETESSYLVTKADEISSNVNTIKKTKTAVVPQILPESKPSLQSNLYRTQLHKPNNTFFDKYTKQSFVKNPNLRIEKVALNRNVYLVVLPCLPYDPLHHKSKKFHMPETDKLQNNSLDSSSSGIKSNIFISQAFSLKSRTMELDSLNSNTTTQDQTLIPLITKVQKNSSASRSKSYECVEKRVPQRTKRTQTKKNSQSKKIKSNTEDYEICCRKYMPKIKVQPPGNKTLANHVTTRSGKSVKFDTTFCKHSFSLSQKQKTGYMDSELNCEHAKWFQSQATASRKCTKTSKSNRNWKTSSNKKCGIDVCDIEMNAAYVKKNATSGSNILKRCFNMLKLKKCSLKSFAVNGDKPNSVSRNIQTTKSSPSSKYKHSTANNMNSQTERHSIHNKHINKKSLSLPVDVNKMVDLKLPQIISISLKDSKITDRKRNCSHDSNPPIFKRIKSPFQCGDTASKYSLLTNQRKQSIVCDKSNTFYCSPCQFTGLNRKHDRSLYEETKIVQMALMSRSAFRRKTKDKSDGDPKSKDNNDKKNYAGEASKHNKRLCICEDCPNLRLYAASVQSENDDDDDFDESKSRRYGNKRTNDNGDKKNIRRLTNKTVDTLISAKEQSAKKQSKRVLCQCRGERADNVDGSSQGETIAVQYGKKRLDNKGDNKDKRTLTSRTVDDSISKQSNKSYNKIKNKNIKKLCPCEDCPNLKLYAASVQSDNGDDDDFDESKSRGRGIKRTNNKDDRKNKRRFTEESPDRPKPKKNDKNEINIRDNRKHKRGLNDEIVDRQKPKQHYKRKINNDNRKNQRGGTDEKVGKTKSKKHYPINSKSDLQNEQELPEKGARKLKAKNKKPKYNKRNVKDKSLKIKTEKCICGSKVCKKEFKKKVKPKVEAKPCTCASSVCKIESEKMKMKGHVCKCHLDRLKRDKIIEREKHLKLLEKKCEAKRRDAQKRAEIKRKKKQQWALKSAKRDEKQVQEFKNQKVPDCSLLAESIVDFSRASINLGVKATKAVFKAIFSPKCTYYSMRKAMRKSKKTHLEHFETKSGFCANIKAVFKECIQKEKTRREIMNPKETKEGQFCATIRRIKNRTKAMKTVQALHSKIESNPTAHYIFNAQKPGKPVDLKPKKRRKRKEQLDFECNIFMASLRRRPWLYVYNHCPWFYPQCLSLVKAWRECTNILLFLLAVGFWTPFIITIEACRALLCCFFCTG